MNEHLNMMHNKENEPTNTTWLPSLFGGKARATEECMRCMRRDDNALALHVIELKEELAEANNEIKRLSHVRVHDVKEHHAEKAEWDCERKEREGREENLKEKLNQTVAERERCIRELLKWEPVLFNMVENLQCTLDSFKKITSEKFEGWIKIHNIWGLN